MIHGYWDRNIKVFLTIHDHKMTTIRITSITFLLICWDINKHDKTTMRLIFKTLGTSKFLHQDLFCFGDLHTRLSVDENLCSKGCTFVFVYCLCGLLKKIFVVLDT